MVYCTAGLIYFKFKAISLSTKLGSKSIICVMSFPSFMLFNI